MVGPVYEIVAVGSELHDGVGVRVVETGEELDYRLTHILEGPLELMRAR